MAKQMLSQREKVVLLQAATSWGDPAGNGSWLRGARMALGKVDFHGERLLLALPHPCR